MDFEAWMEHAVRAVEIVGVSVLAIGSIVTLVGAARTLLGGESTAAYERARHGVGRSISLGLEILIIALVVQTITIDHTLGSAATLGVLVFVRTILGIALVIELDGVAPWRKKRAGALAGSPSDSMRLRPSVATGAWRPRRSARRLSSFDLEPAAHG